MFNLSMTEDMKGIILAGLDSAARDLGRHVSGNGSGVSGDVAMKLIAVHNTIVAVQSAPAAAAPEAAEKEAVNKDPAPRKVGK